MSDCFVTSCLSGFYVQKVCLYILIQRQNYLLCFYLLKEVNALQFCQQLFFVSTWMWVITRPLQFHWIQTFRQDNKNINFHNMRAYLARLSYWEFSTKPWCYPHRRRRIYGRSQWQCDQKRHNLHLHGTSRSVLRQPRICCVNRTYRKFNKIFLA